MTFSVHIIKHETHTVDARLQLKYTFCQTVSLQLFQNVHTASY